MNRRKKHMQEIVDSHLGLFDSSPAEEIARAEERAFRRLNSETVSVTHESVLDGYSVNKWRWGIVAAAVAAVLIISIQIPDIRDFVWGIDAHAMVETPDGGRHRVEAGELVRSDDIVGTVLRLADGSSIEMRSKSELSLERAHDGVRIHLSKGGVIVNAAKQRPARHLYVQTKDVTVSVVGTVFLVNAEEEGSRVAVIEGEVRVKQGETEKSLRPGEQVATNPSMFSPPVKEEISWSRNAEAHIALLQQSAVSTGSPGKTITPQLQFEVTSLRKESENTGVRGAPVRCNAADGVFPLPPRGTPNVPGNGSNVPRGRCEGRYVTLMRLITTAYAVPDRNVSGGPDWVRSMDETFQIEAKAEAAATVTREQLREMLQKMLADRFKLRVRREMKEAPGYALGLAKNGSQLRQTSGDEDLYLEQNGLRNQFNLMRGGQISIKGKSTLKTFADYLGTAPVISLNHVVDKTGLPGMYEFSLTLNMVPPDLTGGVGPRGGGAAPSGPRVEWDPSISKAMEEQLGLRLDSEKLPEEFLVIEHVEKPTEN